MAQRWFSVPVAVTFLIAPLTVYATPGSAGAALPPAPPRRPATQLVISPRSLGTVSPYLFGSNLLWPYDAEGAFDRTTGQFFPQFVEQVNRLGVTALRYPGGITSDSFQWMRAIGPQRRRRYNEPYGMQSGRLSNICCTLDGPAPSTVGPDEFGRLLDQTGAVGDITVNFVTGNAAQAAGFVAYMTAPLPRRHTANPANPGYWAELRARNGHPAPYRVPYWEVGNEQDGPGQFGWRSGQVVSVGHHVGRCSRAEAAVCLYAFGGTTSFRRQAVGTFADEQPQASLSDGLPGQNFYAYFPPVVPHSQAVYVDGRRWHQVTNLAAAQPGASVYTLEPSTGRISFGGRRHGQAPPDGARVSLSYESGPHDGFVEFYAAMKRMNPQIKVCEAEEANTAFLAVMGHRYPYDCVELHEYAKPLDVGAPMGAYERSLMTAPAVEGARLGAVQAAVRHYSGRDAPVVLTEYGQLVVPMPKADPHFNLSLDEGLLVASQLRQWIDHGLPLAEKYLLNSSTFLGAYPVSLSIDETGLSINSAMIAGPGPPFVAEPTGQAVSLMSELAGGTRLQADLLHGPIMPAGGGAAVSVLQPLVVRNGAQLDVLVINVSPDAPVRADLVFDGVHHDSYMSATLLSGTNPLAFNTLYQPYAVSTTTRPAVAGRGNFSWLFPAHSVTLLQMAAPGS